jgi:TRAP-type C4-dicarboxylate transport system permease small subunit
MGVFFKILDEFEEYFLATTLLVMLVLTFTEVVSRYVLHLSMAFAEEITINLFVWSVMVGAATAAKHNKHIGFTLLSDLMPPSVRRWLVLGVAAVCVGALGLIGWYGVTMVMSQMYYGQLTPALQMPEWIMGLSIPVGALLCMIRFLQAGCKDWQELGKEEAQ